jgi:hypothetical protein
MEHAPMCARSRVPGQDLGNRIAVADLSALPDWDRLELYISLPDQYIALFLPKPDATAGVTTAPIRRQSTFQHDLTMPVPRPIEFAGLGRATVVLRPNERFQEQTLVLKLAPGVLPGDAGSQLDLVLREACTDRSLQQASEVGQ